MKKIIVVLFAFAGSLSGYAQNVGIGNSNPDAKLEVVAEDSGLVIFHNIQDAVDSVKTRMYFKTGGFYTGGIGTQIIAGDGFEVPYARLGFFTYGSTLASGLLERMSIADGGNVGINNVNPSATLDVNGSFRLRGNGMAAGNVLTTDANGLATWQAPAALALPFSATVSNNAPLFKLTNSSTTGAGGALYGISASNFSGGLLNGITAVLGELTNVSGGSNSAAVKGINRSTTANGFGVIGYQAGSGSGVYGETVSGTGVYGSGNTGEGVYGFSNSGKGVQGYSATGTGGDFTTNTGTALQTTGKVKLTGIGEGAGKVLTSDAAGSATWQAAGTNVGFVARLSSDQTVTNNSALMNFTELTDDGNGFNPTTGIYTAPSAGLYTFKGRITFPLVAGNNAYTAKFTITSVGTTAEQSTAAYPFVSGYTSSVELNITRKLNAGDTVTLSAAISSSASISLSGGSTSAATSFTGFKVY